MNSDLFCFVLFLFMLLFSFVESLKNQPRPQGLLAFQYGGGSGEDPGK